jgi:nucleoid-associated protein YgaU
VAARYYQRAGEWRRIAEENGIEDPRRLETGRVLRVPAIVPGARR